MSGTSPSASRAGSSRRASRVGAWKRCQSRGGDIGAGVRDFRRRERPRGSPEPEQMRMRALAWYLKTKVIKKDDAQIIRWIDGRVE